MPDNRTRSWDKVQEFASGKYRLLGDGSVRLVGAGLTPIVADIVAQSRPASIRDVLIGGADVSGWRPARPGDYPHGHAPGTRGRSGPEAIVIGLRQGPESPDALKALRPRLAPGARLFVPSAAAANAFDAFGHGFSGGVFVAT